MWVADGLVAKSERRARFHTSGDGLEFSPVLDHKDTVVFISALADIESTIYAILSVSGAPGVDAASWCSATKKQRSKSLIPVVFTACASANEDRIRDVANMGKKVAHISNHQYACIYGKLEFAESEAGCRGYEDMARQKDSRAAGLDSSTCEEGQHGCTRLASEKQLFTGN
jgi:hypothetical protein